MTIKAYLTKNPPFGEIAKNNNALWRPLHLSPNVTGTFLFKNHYIIAQKDGFVNSHTRLILAKNDIDYLAKTRQKKCQY
jgi:hypothetical protein